MRKRMFCSLAALFLPDLGFADITVKPDGTWSCDTTCTIKDGGAGKIKIFTSDGQGREMCMVLDSKDLKGAEPPKPSPDSPGL